MLSCKASGGFLKADNEPISGASIVLKGMIIFRKDLINQLKRPRPFDCDLMKYFDVFAANAEPN